MFERKLPSGQPSFSADLADAPQSGCSRLNRMDTLKLRDRPFPRIPQELAVVEDPSFELASIDLPLFSRPLATLWTRVAVVGYEEESLKLFDVVHADMLGEGSVSRTATAETGTPGVASGMSLVTCALALVDADMPLIVVRPRYEKPFTLPTQLREYDTELDKFNQGFRLFSEDAYAATAIVDQRTIDAIRGFDPGTAIEIRGRAVLMYTSRRDSSLRLIQQAANLARTFPRVVTRFSRRCVAPRSSSTRQTEGTFISLRTQQRPSPAPSGKRARGS